MKLKFRSVSTNFVFWIAFLLVFFFMLKPWIAKLVVLFLIFLSLNVFVKVIYLDFNSKLIKIYYPFRFKRYKEFSLNDVRKVRTYENERRWITNSYYLRTMGVSIDFYIKEDVFRFQLNLDKLNADLIIESFKSIGFKLVKRSKEYPVLIEMIKYSNRAKR